MAFKASLFLLCTTLLVDCSIAAAGHTRQTRDVPQETAVPELDRQADIREIVDKGLWPVYVLYTGFVGGAVQTRYLTELEEDLGKWTSFEDMGNSFTENWEDWVIYFIGFVICAAVGIVAFFAMLISLIVVPSCRCCGKCGAKFDPMDTKKSDRQRLSCSITLIIFNCILVLGAACMYASNEHIKHQLSGSTTVFDNINAGLLEVPPFLDQSVNEINASVLQTYDKSKDMIFAQLYKLPVTALSVINEQTQLLETYSRLETFSNSLGPLDQTLDTIVSDSDTLQSNASSLGMKLDNEKSTILIELTNCHTPECYEAGNLTESLQLNVNYSTVDVTPAARATQQAIDGNLPLYIDYVGGNITEISSTVNESVYQAVREANDQANEIQDDIAEVIKDLEDTVKDIDLSDISSTLADVEETVEHEHIDDIIYWSILILSTTVCLIVFTNLVALVQGFACPRPRNRAPCTDCDTRQASHWLRTSAAFTFIFYWIYVLVVMASFLGGGIIYSEVCRNVIEFNEPESVAVLDTLDRLINETITSEGGDIKSVAVFDAYRQCEQDKTVYVAFRLAENGYNLTEMLDLSAVEKAIEDIKKQPIKLPTITLYPQRLEYILNLLQTSLHLEYDVMIEELGKDVTTVDLNHLANELESLTYSTLNLNASIQALRQLAANDVKDIENLAASTKNNVEFVQANITDLNFTVLGSALNHAENYLNLGDGEQDLEQFVDNTADEVFQNITEVANLIILDIETNVANCRPVYDTVTKLVDDTCVRALYPLNVLWFSLGWCLLFLIPHLILSMKLSKLYKKTIPYVKDYNGADYSDDTELHPVVLAGRPPAAYNKANVLEDPQVFDNLAIDPLEEYRQEIARREAKRHSAFGGSPPPAYGEVKPLASGGMKLPRPQVNHSPVSHQDIILPYYGGADSKPLAAKVPAPAYGEVNSSDPDLAYLY